MGLRSSEPVSRSCTTARLTVFTQTLKRRAARKAWADPPPPLVPGVLSGRSNRYAYRASLHNSCLPLLLASCCSDLNDAEWALLAPLIPTSKPNGRPRSLDMRRITNGVFYLLRTGCARRYLPREYGAWQTV